jgi:DNA-directed RNA polymerase I and III subunit RPAC2
MSVNEVKVKKSAIAFQIRGTGPPASRTFAIGNEDHTLGNALRHVLVQNAKVGFAGYSVPHPSDPVVHIRVQANEPTTAVAALQEACETLSKQCDIVLEKLEQRLPEVKQDKIDIDDKLEKMVQEEEEEEDEDEMVEEVYEEGMEE